MRAVSLIVTALLVSAVGCSEASNGDTVLQDTGTVSLQLVTAVSNGTSYRLQNANFTITGSVSKTAQGNVNTPTVDVTLPVGSYVVKLESGWSLVRIVNGIEQTIAATLVSQNPLQLVVTNQAVSSVSFKFSADSGAIEFGSGRAQIGFEVEPAGSFELLADEGEAHGISADGNTVFGAVGNASTGTFGLTAARWTKTAGMESLGQFPGGYTYATAMSTDGSVFVGAGYDGVGTSFIWTAPTLLQKIAPPALSSRSEANDVSADGKTVVGLGWRSSNQSEAYRWTAATGTVGLGVASTDAWSQAYGVSADGKWVVGGASDGAVRWSSTNTRSIVVAGSNGYAWDVSADGTIIVGTSTNKAFVWQSGSVTQLPVIADCTYHSAQAVSPNGKYVVGYGYKSDIDIRPFIWDSTRGQRLVSDVLATIGVTFGDAKITKVTGIADDGRTIVGNAVQNNHTRPFRAKLPN